MPSNALQKPLSNQSKPTIHGNIQKIEYGKTTIEFNVTYSNRKTLEIAVYPDQNVWVTSPKDASMEKIHEKVRKRGRWIVKQLRYFKRFDPHDEFDDYISGETHRYLGKQYRLKVIQVNDREKETVKLKNGYFQIYTVNKGDKEHVKYLLDTWYRRKAEKKFHERLGECLDILKKHEISKPRLQVYFMEKRWGSFTPSGKVLLNPDLIKHPVYCIDYVIIHELCHTKHPNHDKEFYDFLNKVLPDWVKRKHKLEGYR
jgi:predicted metal-dependent hydrolase